MVETTRATNDLIRKEKIMKKNKAEKEVDKLVLQHKNLLENECIWIESVPYWYVRAELEKRFDREYEGFPVEYKKALTVLWNSF